MVVGIMYTHPSRSRALSEIFSFEIYMRYSSVLSKYGVNNKKEKKNNNNDKRRIRTSVLPHRPRSNGDPARPPVYTIRDPTRPVPFRFLLRCRTHTRQRVRHRKTFTREERTKKKNNPEKKGFWGAYGREKAL